jgi:hypothetical protein
VTLDVLLANERVPEAVPLLCGVNATEKGTLWPAAIVIGKDIPWTENSELLLLSEVMVTFDPTAVNFPVCEAVDPTVMFPKETLAGDTLSWPVAIPVPVKGTHADVEFFEFIICSVPLT